MDRYDDLLRQRWNEQTTGSGKQRPRQLELLRQIQRAAGLDPDGPPLVPMQQPRLSRDEARRAAHRAAKIVVRDAMLRRALRLLW
jgi:hypothetical protein